MLDSHNYAFTCFITNPLVITITIDHLKPAQTQEKLSQVCCKVLGNIMFILFLGLKNTLVEVRWGESCDVGLAFDDLCELSVANVVAINSNLSLFGIDRNKCFPG